MRWRLNQRLDLSTFQRRALSIGAVVALVVTSPAWLPLALVGAAVADLLTGPTRLRFLRLLGFATTYLIYEVIGLAACLGLWLATGFGVAMRADWSQDAHHRLQWWWTTRLFRAIETFGAAQFDVDDNSGGFGGPAVVAGRHTSIADALLPAVVIGGQHRVRMRTVLKTGLQFEPLLDIVGHRLPNQFVERSAPSSDQLAALAELGRGLDEQTVAVIFPEGTFRTRKRHDRAIARLRRRSPALADRADGLRHLLPPRPAGTFALLDASPDADLIFFAHVGFERFSSIAAIVANVPFDSPVRVHVWRVERHDVPSDEDARMDWLLGQWERMDAWIDDQRNP